MAKGGPGPGGKGPAGGLKTGKSMPVSGGKISSKFGPRKDPKTGKSSIHRGVDFKVPVGTPVRTTDAGTVIRAGWQNPKNHKEGFGLRVTIDHGNGNTSVSGHLSSLDVKKGDVVTKGEVIGKSGNTGKSTGPHLHYEERHNGKAHPPTFHPRTFKPAK